MKRLRATFSFLTLMLIGITATAIGGFTLATFFEIKKIDQQIGYSGSVKTTIFFNANIWNTDNPNFYLWDETNDLWISPSKTIIPTIGGVDFSLTVFEINTKDTTSEPTRLPVTTFKFARMNPNPNLKGENYEYPRWNIVSPDEATQQGDGRACWNSTIEISRAVDSTVNYYCVTGWGPNNNNYASTIETNTLTTDQYGNLVFA